MKIDRLPPTEIECERGLLSACLIDPANLDLVVDAVQATDFFDEGFGRMYRVMAMLRQTRQPVNDPRILQPALIDANVPPDYVTTAALAKLLDGTASHATYYAARIARAAKLRRQIISCERAIHDAYANCEPDDVSAKLAADMRGIEGSGKDVPETIGAAARRLLESIDSTNGGGGRHVMFGVQAIDAISGGMCSGELVVIAARPGCGKTSLATQIARHVAEKRGQVLFVSIEMTKTELASRELCGDSEVPSRRMRQSSLSPQDMTALMQAASALQTLPMWIWAPPRTTVQQIAGVARLRHNHEPLHLIVVDYLQRVRPDDFRMQRHQQVGQISGDLKALAKEFECPVIALAQLNREGEDAPRLSSLRESGDIEADADMVFFIHKTKNGTDGILAKHRHGETGVVQLNWDGTRTRFDDGRTDFGGF